MPECGCVCVNTTGYYTIVFHGILELTRVSVGHRRHPAPIGGHEREGPRLGYSILACYQEWRNIIHILLTA